MDYLILQIPFLSVIGTTIAMSASLTMLFLPFARRFCRQPRRRWLPTTHDNKHNTPTMYGVVIIASILCSLIYYVPSSTSFFALTLCIIGFGTIGFIDDMYKLTHLEGISSHAKFALQTIISSIITYLLLELHNWYPAILIPFTHKLIITPTLFYALWSLFIIIGTSNAVNLTDGLDGLALSCIIPPFFIFSVITYCNDQYWLTLLALICTTTCITALYINWHPARAFMGDTGSLALGALLATIALLSGYEYLLAISGFVFVIETFSVILQIGSKKLRNKKLFLMAPIHHHFELLAWSETKIVMFFASISTCASLLALFIFFICTVFFS
jgi:phospho-N-acetylmuramoyl-pentapeptide-transferase